MNYGCEVAMGAVCGLRTFTGPAIVAGAARGNILKPHRTTLACLAAGELIADKLPFMPNRTDVPGLAARFIAGAICGVAIAGRRKRSERIMSGIVGGAAAIAAAYAGVQYRKHVKLPPLPAALLEDAVAVGVGSLIVAQVGCGLCP
jgi:uncharacterized membrane protein